MQRIGHQFGRQGTIGRQEQMPQIAVEDMLFNSQPLYQIVDSQVIESQRIEVPCPARKNPQQDTLYRGEVSRTICTTRAIPAATFAGACCRAPVLLFRSSPRPPPAPPSAFTLLHAPDHMLRTISTESQVHGAACSQVFSQGS